MKSSFNPNKQLTSPNAPNTERLTPQWMLDAYAGKPKQQETISPQWVWDAYREPVKATAPVTNAAVKVPSNVPNGVPGVAKIAAQNSGGGDYASANMYGQEQIVMPKPQRTKPKPQQQTPTITQNPYANLISPQYAWEAYAAPSTPATTPTTAATNATGGAMQSAAIGSYAAEQAQDPSTLDNETQATNSVTPPEVWDYYKDLYTGSYKDLEQRQAEALANLDEETRKREQEAYINAQLVKKYLPEQLNAQGLGNLGVSQSLLQQIENDYMNQVAAVNRYLNRERFDIKDYFANERKAVDEKVDVDKALEYDRAITRIDDWIAHWQDKNGGSLNDENKAELENMLKEYEGRLSQKDYDELKRVVDDSLGRYYKEGENNRDFGNGVLSKGEKATEVKVSPFAPITYEINGEKFEYTGGGLKTLPVQNPQIGDVVYYEGATYIYLDYNGNKYWMKFKKK